MTLSEVLNIQADQKKIGLSEERVSAIIPIARQYIAFWREYPDIFIDFLLEMGNPQDFKFYFYQRCFLRVCMRYKYVYMVFPRAWDFSAPTQKIFVDKLL